MKFKKYLRDRGVASISAFERKPKEVQHELRKEFEAVSGEPAPKARPNHAGNKRKRQLLRARGRSDKALLRSTGEPDESSVPDSGEDDGADI